jgi:DNA-binding transcriptional MocR family regulator
VTGTMRAPAALLPALTISKQAADLHTSTVDQHAARVSLQAADIDEHIARICREYRLRRDALLDNLAAALPPGSAFNRPAGGMFVWARLPAGWDAAELLAAALRHDVAFVPGAPHAGTDRRRTRPADRGDDRLRLRALTMHRSPMRRGARFRRPRELASAGLSL